MKTLKYIFFFSLFSPLLSSCLSDDHIPKQVNETEVISDVSLEFTNSKDKKFTYSYTAPKYRSEDYKDPIITLKSGETYQVSTHFYDRSNPDEIEDVTQEVSEEKDDHFLEFKFYNTAIALIRTDQEETTDRNEIPIGLFTQWTAGSPAKGSVRITLIHEPTKKKVDPPIGAHSGGETDAQVDIDLTIK